MNIDPLNNVNNGNNGNNSWGQWAIHILDSTKTFKEEIKQIKIDLSSLNKDTNSIQTELVKFTSSNRIDLLIERYDNQFKAIELRLNGMEDTINKHSTNLDDLNNFKTKIIAVVATVNVIFTIALAIVGSISSN